MWDQKSKCWLTALSLQTPTCIQIPLVKAKRFVVIFFCSQRSHIIYTLPVLYFEHLNYRNLYVWTRSFKLYVCRLAYWSLLLSCVCFPPPLHNVVWISQEKGSESKVIVAVRQGNLLATAFHPELTSDNRWYIVVLTWNITQQIVVIISSELQRWFMQAQLLPEDGRRCWRIL